MKKNIALIILLTIVATAKAQMEKGFKTPPAEMCSHVILGWDGEISPEVISRDLSEIQAKGFRNVIIELNILINCLSERIIYLVRKSCSHDSVIKYK